MYGDYCQVFVSEWWHFQEFPRDKTHKNLWLRCFIAWIHVSYTDFTRFHARFSKLISPDFTISTSWAVRDFTCCQPAPRHDRFNYQHNYTDVKELLPGSLNTVSSEEYHLFLAKHTRDLVTCFSRAAPVSPLDVSHLPITAAAAIFLPSVILEEFRCDRWTSFADVVFAKPQIKKGK